MAKTTYLKRLSLAKDKSLALRSKEKFRESQKEPKESTIK